MRKLQGTVVSNKMDKTVVVKVRRVKVHPKYKKRYRIDTKYKVHDEENEFQVGDNVVIQETIPISKDKRWRVVEVLEKAPGQQEQDQEQEV